MLISGLLQVEGELSGGTASFVLVDHRILHPVDDISCDRLPTLLFNHLLLTNDEGGWCCHLFNVREPLGRASSPFSIFAQREDKT